MKPLAQRVLESELLDPKYRSSVTKNKKRQEGKKKWKDGRVYDQLELDLFPTD